ncbi:sulfotransferase [Nannochloropsis oceanica]
MQILTVLKRHPLWRLNTPLVGFLAAVCVFPFIFSTLSNNDPNEHQIVITRTPHKALRYEAASVAEDRDKVAPVRKPKPEQRASLRQEKSADTATDITQRDKAAPAAAEHKAPPAAAAESEAAMIPATREPIKLNAGFITVETSDPSKKALVAHRQDSDIHIYMDWTLPAERFSLLNYRSLESVLTQYPNAKVRTLVVAPSRATRHDYANTLSYMQFEKYQKRGYNVQFDIVSEKSLLELQDPNRPGFTYFTTVLFPRLQKTIFDESFFTKTENAVQDFKTNHFIRLFRLWQTGGIYMDFTMLLTKPLPTGRRIWSFAEDCGTVASPATEAVEATSTFDDGKWRYSGSQHPYVLQLKAQDPIVGCVLARFDDKGDSLHECMLKSQKGGADCIEGAFQQCAKPSVDVQSDVLETRASVDWPSCNSTGNKTKGVSSIPPAGSVAVVAMGREAMEGNWTASSFTAALIGKYIHLDRWHPSQIDPQCARKCDYYADALARVRAPFHLTKFSLSKAHAEASNYICAPSVIMPGVIKAASSSLFGAIAKHPQVLHPLRGSNFKETGVYMNIPGRDHFKDRLQAFPFIEADENFVTTDGTVYYINGDESPEQIVADSPSAKAIISLRDPTSRAYSQYRNTFFNGTESFAEAVRVSVPILRKCYQEHLARVDLRAVLNESKGADFWKKIDFCTAPLMRTPTRRTIQTSLYLPQLMRWASVMGIDRILVVTKEELSRDPKPVVAEVFKFLGLCPFEEAFAAEVVRKIDVPKGYDLTEGSLMDLNEAFQPWNHALAQLLGRDLGWLNHEEAFVKSKLHFHRIVIFQSVPSVKSPCKACEETHALLAAQQGVDAATDIEVVALRHDDPVWAEVVKAAGTPNIVTQDSLPYVFVRGEYMGSLKEEGKQKDGSQSKLAAALSAASKQVEATDFASYYAD